MKIHPIFLLYSDYIRDYWLKMMQKFSKLMIHAVRQEMEAKGRPDTIFKQKFYDMREKVKAIKNNWEKRVGDKLEKQLLDDLKSKNVSVIEHKFSLGKYRGSRFVTSFKLKIQVKSQKEAENLVDYLKGKYSPKWRLNKISDDGVADLNLRGKDIMQKKVARELLHIAKDLMAEELEKGEKRHIQKVLFEAYDVVHDYRKNGYPLEDIEGHLEEAIDEFRKL